MTNDMKAPENIALIPSDGWSWTTWPIAKQDDPIRYTRHDLHLSLVAAAYDNAASRVNQLSHTATATGNFAQASALANEAESIRDSTPADAQAALEARDKQIREEALREAVDVAHDAVLDHGDDQVQVRFAVLALIEKDKTDDQE